MTLVSTKFNAARNWSQRLPIARDIWAEVRAERILDSTDVELKSQQIAAEAEFVAPRMEE